MLDFEELEISLQKQIIDICEDDQYNLDPKTLYRNIFNSKGDIQTLSKVFEVPELLIIEIKEKGVELP
ncbi:hypothetical protein [Aliarcobacter cryaerophilus]|uniref:Uncharacterized protein n=1 Tax=Arcobacter sp. AZ-2023 TaxID=3074453 RepID=A0AA96IFH7_9BACT|nr:hypothetical protein RMQ68_01960 [Arcobacter sp. AZ-2023]